MMSLTQPQAKLLRFLVREIAQGRSVTYLSIARGLQISRSNAFDRRKRLAARISDDEIATLVPRDPTGARLRFIPVDDLAGIARHD